MKNPFFLFILSFVTFSSCYKATPIEVEDVESKIVINSLMVSGENPIVQISRTSTDFTSPVPVIDTAGVELYRNNNKIATLSNIGGGKYISDSVRYEAGGNYRLTVRVNNKSYSVKQEIPRPREIYKIIYLNKAGKTKENITYPGVKLYISNDASKRLYFQLRIYNLREIDDTLRPYEVHYFEFNDTLFARQGLDIPIFTNEGISDDTIAVQLNLPSGNGPYVFNQYPIIIELNTISEDYYKFLRSVFLYEQGRFPIFVNSPPPVFSTYSNIENGLGIVGGIATIRTDTIIP